MYNVSQHQECARLALTLSVSARGTRRLYGNKRGSLRYELFCPIPRPILAYTTIMNVK